jgi:predicted CXXCH cytochrome family protein
LNAGCVACHTATTGQVSEFQGPVVLHINPPLGQGNGNTLAGGDFYWVNVDEITNTALGHNVIDLPGITAKDTNMPDFNPPGWDPEATSGFVFGRVAAGESSWSTQLTCGGAYGCHGLHTVEGSFPGLRGGHHNNPGGPATKADVADTVGNSYRFLGGIKGLEEAGWNWNETSAIHNEYYGENNMTDRSTGLNYGSRDSISFMCAECHGFFHSIIDSDAIGGPPWIRHPTDIALPDAGEYALYNTPDGATVGTYSLEAPVARPVVPDSSSPVVTAGIDIVMCLSCHRAHGSDQNDLLRWNYDDMIAGGTNSGGCFVCHNDKNELGVNP